ncbi:Protein FYV10 [Cyberlindnera fabianii]|uniref:Protein FYV10 n=1 Tax=Cyberlindnera fabianii TaxID=36022 RepID=A0A1V2L3J3_CYBFA|nr:Protein FYV10 [Cyberlindnera fabianii]
MSLNEPSVDMHVRMLESSFRIPHEAIKRNLKTVQKLDEKQFKKTDELLKNLSKCKTQKDKLAKLKQMITNAKQYEKKMKARVAVEQDHRERIEARIEKIKELKELKEAENSDEEDASSTELHQNRLLKWYRDRTNLLIADYLLKNHESIENNPGILLLKNLGFEKLVDSDMILVSNRISKSILNKDLSQLITWINDNKSYLKKIKSNLEFEARFQQYIELIKANDISSALSVFSENLTPFTDSNFEEIKIAAGMLVFTKKIINAPTSGNYDRYNHLLSPTRYKKISDLFLKIFYRLHCIPEDDPLLVYLSIGISSLKTRSCICVDESTAPMDLETILTQKLNNSQSKTMQHNSCPVCALEFQQLSGQLPYSHNVNSHLFDNPVMLPTHNIFDKAKLSAYTETLLGPDSGEVVDPITGDQFDIGSLEVMYPA